MAHLVTENNKEWIYFQVTDTGKGIEKDEIEKLFNEFNQVGDAQDKQKGTGLGLAISRKLCRLLGGDITLRSAIGVGTTFTVMVPRWHAGVHHQLNNNDAA